MYSDFKALFWGLRVNALELAPRVLILSGSHGDGESGRSGLTDIGKLRDSADKNAGDITVKFYEGDCMRAGLKPVKPRVKIEKLPIPDGDIPDITQGGTWIALKKLENFLSHFKSLLRAGIVSILVNISIKFNFTHRPPFEPKIMPSNCLLD